MKNIEFIKMHGLGNDFVIIDTRQTNIKLNTDQVRAIADRHTGVGCDQLVLIEKPRNELSDAFMRIYNADGFEVDACGNASRCVAQLIGEEKGIADTLLETNAGLLDAHVAKNGDVTVDMGQAKFDWREIPIAKADDTLHLDFSAGPLKDPAAVNMGNPHVVFFMDEVETLDLNVWGPEVEQDDFFPERTNVEIAQIIGKDKIRMRVWERGAGITLACGSGACATAVAAARRGLTGRQADVIVDGGTLHIDWLQDNNVLMTGPVATSFTGTIDESLLDTGGKMGNAKSKGKKR